MTLRTLSVSAILLGALGATACAATHTQEAAGEVIDDSVITSKVKTSLIDDPVTKARQIDVETFRGVVQLNGFVDSAASKSRASEIALATKGVTRVDNNLEVKNTDTSVGVAIDDSVLTTKVKAALIADPKTKAHEINVETLRGVVQLSGFVDSDAAKSAAANVAASVTGVRDVHNDIAIKPAS